MTEYVLKLINDLLTQSGIHYEFGEWNSDLVYPYFVGEYTEIEPYTEDGLQEADFMLNGFSNGTWTGLEAAKATIERLFSNCTMILENGSGVDISYAGSLIVPTGDATLKRIQVNLRIKEWKV